MSDQQSQRDPAPREHTEMAPREHTEMAPREHTEMDCRAALTELSTYLDGELTEDRRSLIARHLDDCNPCLEIYDFEAELRLVIQKRCQDAVPDTLRLRVEDQLRGFVAGPGDTGPPGAPRSV